MAEQTGKKKVELTPRQAEIKRLIARGREKRSDQESARLDQLKMEERRDRFLHLAPKRVQKALKALAQVANCGNRQSYAYTDEEALKIGLALKRALDTCGESFSPRSRGEDKFAL